MNISFPFAAVYENELQDNSETLFSEINTIALGISEQLVLHRKIFLYCIYIYAILRILTLTNLRERNEVEVIQGVFFPENF